MTTATTSAPSEFFGKIRTIVASPRFARIFSVVLFFASWQLIVPLLPTHLIPLPSKVLGFMWDEVRGITLGRTTVWEAFGISLGRLGIGFTMAFFIGLLGRMPRLERDSTFLEAGRESIRHNGNLHQSYIVG